MRMVSELDSGFEAGVGCLGQCTRMLDMGHMRVDILDLSNSGLAPLDTVADPRSQRKRSCMDVFCLFESQRTENEPFAIGVAVELGVRGDLGTYLNS